MPGPLLLLGEALVGVMVRLSPRFAPTLLASIPVVTHVTYQVFVGAGPSQFRAGTAVFPQVTIHMRGLTASGGQAFQQLARTFSSFPRFQWRQGTNWDRSNAIQYFRTAADGTSRHFAVEGARVGDTFTLTIIEHTPNGLYKGFGDALSTLNAKQLTALSQAFLQRSPASLSQDLKLVYETAMKNGSPQVYEESARVLVQFLKYIEDANADEAIARTMTLI